MQSAEYTRSKGQHLTYTIRYDHAEYIITRAGAVKKSVDEALVAGLAEQDARAELMLRTAIADIEALNGMEE